MIRALAAAVLAASLASPIEAKVIRDDPGGIIQVYLMETGRLRDSGERVVIKGRCASACTLHLSLPGACVTAGARLGFHRARSESPTAAEFYTQLMLKSYPRKVREWVVRSGAMNGDRVKWLQGSELLRRFRKCAE